MTNLPDYGTDVGIPPDPAEQKAIGEMTEERKAQVRQAFKAAQEMAQRDMKWASFLIDDEERALAQAIVKRLKAVGRPTDLKTVYRNCFLEGVKVLFDTGADDLGIEG